MGRDLFKKAPRNIMYGGLFFNGNSEDDDDEESDDSDSSKSNQRAEHIMNKQSAFVGTTHYAPRRPVAKPSLYGYQNYSAWQQPTEEEEKEEPPMSAFRHAIRAQQ